MTKMLTLVGVARLLSPAQRAAVLWLPADGSERVADEGAPSRVSFYCLEQWQRGRPYRSLTIVAKFVTVAPPTPAAKGSGKVWAPDRYSLTPIGVKLRAIVGTL